MRSFSLWRLFLLGLVFISSTVRAQEWKALLDSAVYYHKGEEDDEANGKDKDYLLEAMKVMENTHLVDTLFANYCSRAGNYCLWWSIGVDEAIKLKRKAINIFKLTDKNDPDHYYNKLMSFSATFIDFGEIPEAKSYSAEAVEVARIHFGDTSMKFAHALVNLGICNVDLYEFSEAEKNYSLAYKIYSQNDKEGSDLADLTMEMGLLYMYMSQFNKSEQLLLAALDHFENKKPNPKRAELITFNLSGLYSLAGDNKNALKYSLATLKTTDPSSGFYYTVAGNVGIAYTNLNQFDSARKYLLISYNMFKKNQDLFGVTYGDMAETLGDLYYKMKQYSNAKKTYLEAISVYDKRLGKNNKSSTSTYTSLGMTCFMLNQLPDAKKYFALAQNISDKTRKELFAFASEEEKKQFIDNDQELVDAMCSLYFREKNAEKLLDISLANKNLLGNASASLMKTIESSGDSSSIRILADLRNAKEALNDAYTTSVEEREESISDLEKKANDLEKALIARVSDAGALLHSEVKDLKSIQQQLKPGEAIVDFFCFSDFIKGYKNYYYATVILPQGQIKMVPLFEESKLKDLFKSGFRSDKDRGAITTANGINAASAYQLIWKPVQAFLGKSNKVYYSPSGLLHKISFAALNVDSTTFLSDKYSLVQLNSPADFKSNEFHLSGKEKMLLFGGIEYSLRDNAAEKNIMQFPFLEGTLKEVKNISRIMTEYKYVHTVYTNQDASEEKFKSASGKSSPDIIHIATHGFFMPGRSLTKEDTASRHLPIYVTSTNPMLHSGLLFAGAQDSWNYKVPLDKDDGVLTAFEVANMYLPNTRLVILSACESGLGNIEGTEGVYGLQRAFKMANVQYIMMSLWKVPDEPTARFMEIFYDLMFQGKNVEDSFNSAVELMKKDNRDRVENWGAWVLLK